MSKLFERSYYSRTERLKMEKIGTVWKRPAVIDEQKTPMKKRRPEHKCFKMLYSSRRVYGKHLVESQLRLGVSENVFDGLVCNVEK